MSALPRLRSPRAGLLVMALGLLALSPSDVWAGKERVTQDCSFRGQKLYGKVKVVDSFPDFKVQKVDSFPDLKVQRVESFPDRCGKWQLVDSFPDFKVKFVDSFPGLP